MRASVSHWRPAIAFDLPAIVSLAAIVHPAFPERPEIFAEKLRLCPSGCFMLAGNAGYALTHPWTGGPPKLDHLLHDLPERPTYHFIHDVALLPEARGKGALRRLMMLLPIVLPLRLVAVSGSAPVWTRLGFHTLLPEPAYGEDALLMERL